MANALLRYHITQSLLKSGDWVMGYQNKSGPFCKISELKIFSKSAIAYNIKIII